LKLLRGTALVKQALGNNLNTPYSIDHSSSKDTPHTQWSWIFDKHTRPRPNTTTRFQWTLSRILLFCSRKLPLTI
jgi:hypothetical protein